MQEKPFTDHFAHLVQEQGWLDSEENWNKLLQLCNDEGIWWIFNEHLSYSLKVNKNFSIKCGRLFKKKFTLLVSNIRVKFYLRLIN